MDSSLTSAGIGPPPQAGSLKDDWDDPVYAANWQSRHLIGNPSRLIQLDVISESLRLVSLEATGPIRILELGSGPGIVAEKLLLAIPDCHVEGVDKSAAMIRIAESRLARFGDRFRQRTMDLAAFDRSRLTETSYHAVIGVQSLHELRGVDQRRVLRELRTLLRPEGLLFYVDRIKPDLARFWRAHAALWKVLCEVAVSEGQPTFEERVRRVRSKSDFVAPLSVTLRMLEETGFTAEPVFVAGERAIIVACVDAAT